MPRARQRPLSGQALGLVVRAAAVAGPTKRSLEKIEMAEGQPMICTHTFRPLSAPMLSIAPFMLSIVFLIAALGADVRKRVG